MQLYNYYYKINKYTECLHIHYLINFKLMLKIYGTESKHKNKIMFKNTDLYVTENKHNSKIEDSQKP